MSIFKLRRGTAAQWTSVNPILTAGEPGYETDTGKPKIGNGTSQWAALEYLVTQSMLNSAINGAQVTAGKLFFNVKDYGALGNGVADDTLAINNAIAAAVATGGLAIVYFPRGVYMHTGIVAASGVMLRGVGKTRSILKTIATATATKALDTTSCTNVIVEDLAFEANGNTTMKSGVYGNTNGSKKNVLVQRCKFTGFMQNSATTTHAAIYFWTTSSVKILENEVIDCGRGITLGTPLGEATVQGNNVTAPRLSNIMATGIRVSGSPGDVTVEGKVRIIDNYVEGADFDASNVGSEGHGITLYRVRDSTVENNHCYYNGRGILASYLCFGTIVTKNHCVGNYDSGIRVEPEISGLSGTDAIGVDVNRGVQIEGNFCRNQAPRTDKPVGGGNYGIGIEISYAAAASVNNNHSHHNTHCGIHIDSDRCIAIGNIVFNNGLGSAPGSTGRTGIYINAGVGTIVAMNQCFDNQSTKTQEWGLWLNNATHRVGYNNFEGNAVGQIGGPGGVGAIREGFFGVPAVAKQLNAGTATGTDAAVLNSVVTALRNLGFMA